MKFARAMGADIVIAVDIYCQDRQATALTVPAVLGKVMQAQSCLVTAPEMAGANVLIAPVLDMPGMSDRASHERAIQAGYAATHTALAKWRSERASHSQHHANHPHLSPAVHRRPGLAAHARGAVAGGFGP